MSMNISPKHTYTHTHTHTHTGVLPPVVCIHFAPLRSDLGWCCCVYGFEPGPGPMSSWLAAGMPTGNARDCAHQRNTLGPLVLVHMHTRQLDSAMIENKYN